MNLDPFRLMSAVLCLENEHVDRLVGAFLRAYGLRAVASAPPTDTEAAGAYLRSGDYDVLLVGMNAPDRPSFGPELIRWVRRAPESPNRYLPVLAISSYGEARWVTAAAAAGVHEYIALPLRGSDLMAKLGRAVLVGRPFVEDGEYFGPQRLDRVDPSEIAARRQAGQALIEAGSGRGRAGENTAK